jgi:hypothetical protein
MPSCQPNARSAFRLSALGLAVVLWQGCGGEDIVVPPEPDPGVVSVTVTTTGSQPDPDGYTVRFDSTEAAIGTGGSVRFTASVGSHTVTLDGLAANCAVQGSDGVSRTVVVDTGDSVAVTYDVLCDATTGAVVITTATSGRLQDPDGYAVAIDGGDAQPIAVDGTVTVGGLAPGDHTATLSGIAENCRVKGNNPLTLTVTTGNTTPGEFQVACVGLVSQWTPVDAGTSADLTDVWSSSPSNVFIVGETSGRGSKLASVIRRFDGTQWTEQFRQTNLRLRGLWGSGPANVYTVGFDFFNPIGRMLHYDGTSWAEVPGFVSDAEQLSFSSIWGSSATDVWAVGGAFDGAFDRALIYHFDGDFWQRMLVADDRNPSLTDVWGVSPTDVYAVGIDGEADPQIGVVEHYDGTSWTPVLEHPGLAPNGVWASSASDVFLVGFQADEQRNGNFIVTSAIWHYDGSTWSPMSVPTGSEVLEEVWGSSPSDVYAVADDGFVLHYDGVQWTAMQQTDQTLLGVFGSSAADVYAVGLGGRVIHGTP